MQLNEAIKKRKSVKKFLDKKPDWRKILRAIDLARFSPAAGNQFVCKFILVSDKGKIKRLAKASMQDFVGHVDYVVAVVSDDSALIKSYEERGERYARQQAGAAIENFLLALTELGLSTCWVGHFSDEEVKEILEVPEKMTVEALFPIGFESKIKTREKAKIDLDNVLYFDKWKQKTMTPKEVTTLESV
jgi:nitroreductase